LIGRCYRQLVAPLSGPIKDQDLRVVAPVLRLSDVVAVAVSQVLIRLSQLPHAAGEVSAPEFPRGVTEIFSRHAEVLLGTAAAMVVAVVIAMAMMAMVTMVTMVVVLVLVIEQITQETSDETSRETQTWKHSHSPLSLGVPAPASCRRSGCLQTVRLRQKQIRPSVICGTFDRSVTTRPQARLRHARRGLECRPSQGIACHRRRDCV
jgi:hypothetical protein